ncbi:MAG: sensor domain-containing diguanylate cyclase [Lachnospiraceae bacterium]
MKFEYSKRILLFLTTFFLSLGILAFITSMYVHNKSDMEYAQMEQIVLVNANKVNNVITKLLYKTQVLEALVIQNNGEVHNFEQVASTIVDDPAIKNVLLAPNGIVSHVYPLKGNEAVLGLDFFSNGFGNKEAVQARDSGQLVLGGPFDLVQGGQSLVGRLPIYIKDNPKSQHFWGLVSVTLNYPQALDGAGLDQLHQQGFAFEIWRLNPDTNQKQVIANSDYAYNSHARYVEKEIQILNANWIFRISPVKNWYEYPETWILSFGSLLVSCLFAFFALHNYDLKVMKKELEVLTYVDPLTGVLNRRGLLAKLDQLIQNPNCRLILCYLDLNKFKSINDQFGHGMGDKVLQQFAELFTMHLPRKHLFARMGGDEFILIFRDTENQKELDDFLSAMKTALTSICIDELITDIPITFSFGKACYPSQCQTIDDLLTCADCDMYKNKMGKTQQ